MEIPELAPDRMKAIAHESELGAITKRGKVKRRARAMNIRLFQETWDLIDRQIENILRAKGQRLSRNQYIALAVHTMAEPHERRRKAWYREQMERGASSEGEPHDGGMRPRP